MFSPSDKTALDTVTTIQTLRDALEVDPLCAATWNALGMAYAAAGDSVKASEAFRRALAIDPDHADAARNQAELIRGGIWAGGATTLAALCCLYDDCRWLEASIASVYPECDRIYFLVSDRPWSGPPRDISATFAAIGNLADPDGKFTIIRGSWQTEAEQRNAGLEAMAASGIGYCFVLDGDEIYDSAELHEMKLAVFRAPEIECWHVTWFTYWKSERFRIEPPEPFQPLVFVRVGSARFDLMRNVNSSSRAMIDPRVGVCHHMSYAHSNEELKKKLSSFSHAHEVLEGWYENTWLKWDENKEMTNLHPTHPACYARAIEQPRELLPPILRRSSVPADVETLSDELDRART